MKEIILLSNTCVGFFIYRDLLKIQYNNPFIGSLIPNDLQFIEFCNNIDKYINLEPQIGEPDKNSLFALQSKNKYYYHPKSNKIYPVIFLGDLEIHFIHETNELKCLQKFNERLKRFKKLFNENKKIIALLSFSEFLNEHSNKQEIISSFFKNKTINKIFIGPEKYNKNYEYYISIKEWNNILLERNQSHIYKFNNQTVIKNLFIAKIKEILKT